MKPFRYLFMLGFTVMVSLSGCSNETDVSEESSSQVSSVLEQTLSDVSIEDELSYIETLVGVEEFSAAKLALETLESNLSQPIDNEELSARLMTLKQSLSEVEVSEKSVTTMPLQVLMPLPLRLNVMEQTMILFICMMKIMNIMLIMKSVITSLLNQKVFKNKKVETASF